MSITRADVYTNLHERMRRRNQDELAFQKKLHVLSAEVQADPDLRFLMMQDRVAEAQNLGNLPYPYYLYKILEVLCQNIPESKQKAGEVYCHKAFTAMESGVSHSAEAAEAIEETITHNIPKNPELAVMFVKKALDQFANSDGNFRDELDQIEKMLRDKPENALQALNFIVEEARDMASFRYPSNFGRFVQRVLNLPPFGDLTKALRTVSHNMTKEEFIKFHHIVHTELAQMPHGMVSDQRLKSTILHTAFGSFYDLQQDLGSGSYKTPHKGLQIAGGKPRTVALVKMEAKNEVDILEKLAGGPSIVSVIGIYRSEKISVVVEELCDSNLHERLYAHVRPTLFQRACYLDDISKGLVHIHSLGITHRDIKTTNILVKGDQAFITDFGISVTRDNLKYKGEIWATSWFQPPELYRPALSVEEIRAFSDSSQDIWALGCVAFEVLNTKGKKPAWFVSPQPNCKAQLMGLKMDTRSQWMPQDEFDPMIYSALEGMLSLYPEQRTQCDYAANFAIYREIQAP